MRAIVAAKLTSSDLKDLSPPRKGIYEGTPCLNSEFFQHVRAGKAEYLRGDTLGLTTNGVRFNKRTRQSKPGDDGEEVELQADVVVMATGFERPSVDFLCVALSRTPPTAQSQEPFPGGRGWAVHATESVIHPEHR